MYEHGNGKHDFVGIITKLFASCLNLKTKACSIPSQGKFCWLYHPCEIKKWDREYDLVVRPLFVKFEPVLKLQHMVFKQRSFVGLILISVGINIYVLIDDRICSIWLCPNYSPITLFISIPAGHIMNIGTTIYKRFQLRHIHRCAS